MSVIETRITSIPALKDWILRNVGEPVVSSHACDEHLDDAIKDAAAWFTANIRGDLKYQDLTLTSGETEYNLPEPGARVIEVVFPDYIDYFDWGNIRRGLYSYRSILGFAPYYFLTDFQQALDRAESINLLTGNDNTWWQEGDKLYIIYRGNAGSTARVIYTVHRQIDLENMTAHENYLFRRAALAFFAKRVARIWGKYDSIPVPGGEKSLNFGELDALYDSIMEELRNALEMGVSTYPVGLITG